MSRGRWACRVLVLLAVLAAIQFVGKPMWRAHRKATVTAEDFQAARVAWYVDSLAAGRRMSHLWFSADGQSLWMADDWAGLTKWDLSTWKVTEQVNSHSGYRVLAGSPDGVLACERWDPVPHQLELRDAIRWTRLGSGRNWTWSDPMVCSRDGRKLVRSYYDSDNSEVVCTSLLDMANPRCEAVLFKHRLIHAAFSRDGSKLVTLHSDDARRRWLTLWDTTSRRQVGLVAADASCERTPCLLGDGYSALVQVHDKQQGQPFLEVLDMRTGRPKSPPIRCAVAKGSPISVSPDEERIAYFGGGGEVMVQDLASPHVVVKPRGHAPEDCAAGAPWLLVFSPDGTHLASTMSDGVVRIWNLVEGREEGSLVCYHYQGGEWLALLGSEGRFLCSPGAEEHLFLRKGTTLYSATPYLERFRSSP